MSEMVERVAKRIRGRVILGHSNTSHTEKRALLNIDYEDLARTAIETMGEPTEAMIRAGELLMVNVTPDSPSVPGLGESGTTSYQRMIDEALK